MTGYADTSFLVSVYLPDANSPAAWALMKSRPYLYLTPFHDLEFVNAIELAVFRGLVKRVEARAVIANYEQDRAGLFAVTAFPPELFTRAEQMARRRTAVIGTRSLDIVHVAAAQILTADVFFSFDERQRKLAKLEGLKVRPSAIARRA